MKDQTNKYGRNAPCPCGSRKKYKKCCRLKEVPQVIIPSAVAGPIKMSEILLEYAEELLKLTKTPEEGEQSIILAITAWNLSFLEKSEYKRCIEDFFQTIKIEEKEKSTLTKIIENLIYKRIQDYSLIDRVIISYKITKKGKDFNLYLVSAFASSDNINEFV